MCYSLMQSCGLVVDHPVGTPEHDAIRQQIEEAASAAVAASSAEHSQSTVAARRVHKRRRQP